MGQVQSDEEFEGEPPNEQQQQQQQQQHQKTGAAIDFDKNQMLPTEGNNSNDSNNSSRQPKVWRLLANLGPTIRGSMKTTSGKTTINASNNKSKTTSGGLEAAASAEAENCVRKLSNVSLRNIQLLSLKPRSELDAYADGLRRRRRSSLINLILGAPSSGPRFSDDLCSLSSHMSELCQFNIEFLPDFVSPQTKGTIGHPTATQLGTTPLGYQPQQQQAYRSQQQHHQQHQHHANELDSYGCVGGVDSTPTNNDELLKQASRLGGADGGWALGRRRRRSSLSSLTSGNSAASVSSPGQHHQAPRAIGAPGDGEEEISELADHYNGSEQQQQQQPGTTSTSRITTRTTTTLGDKQLSSSSAAAATPTPFKRQHFQQHSRRPSLASTALASIDLTSSFEKHDKSGLHQQPQPPLASIQMKPDEARLQHPASDGGGGPRRPLGLGQTISSLISGKPGRFNCPASNTSHKNNTGRTRINQSSRVLRRSGSELSLYGSLSSLASSTTTTGPQDYIGAGAVGLNWPSGPKSGRPDCVLNGRKDVVAPTKQTQPSAAKTTTTTTSKSDPARETKLIIMLQVCLPFILAGFGNMAAGLALNRIAHWRAFQQVPIFFVLLPSFVGLKGNIEMTLASRLSTLSNLKLLDSGHQRRHAYLSNLILILSQAIGLSLFAALIAILCEYLLGGGSSSHVQDPSQNTSTASIASPPPTASSSHQSAVINSTLAAGHANSSAATVNINHHHHHGPSHFELTTLLELAALVVLPSALITASLLVILSSVVMSLAIALANLISVNPDNLSTLIAALYGDVTCVLTYGLFADWMFTNYEMGGRWWPVSVLVVALISYPILCYLAYKFKMTHDLALASMPPMLTGILVSIGSGAVLSLVVGRFSLIALYQPVVNGFGANLVAVQASRVSTWLWCKELRRVSISRGSRLSSVAAAMGNNSDQDQLSQKKLYNSLASFTQDQVTQQLQQQQRRQSIKSAADIAADGGPHQPRRRGQFESFGGIKNRLKHSLKSLGRNMQNCLKLLLWSFCNPSPNSIAARLLLMMLIPAHTIYFFVIWLLSPANYVILTWPFYFVYISLCLLQVFVLLSICEPLMALLMKRHLDPDVFGISLLMALADLVGTLCLTGAFLFLAGIGDVNALIK